MEENLKFEERVLKFLKRGTKSKFARMGKRIREELEDQISTYEKDLKKLKRKLEDQEVNLSDLVHNVDLDRLSNNEGIDNYIEDTYLPALFDAVQNTSVEDQIIEMENKIEVSKAVLDCVNNAKLYIEEEGE
jgi:uncharacterized protein (DUF342 family)